ncbi:MAG TPA: 16S rRNA (cytosine(1402)-N(4))-methyltransferase RsmH [Deltaproteobacteria bacterium]|nr:16S rRNA (cytosine(1402)-N(4))-methyltransferase RsmH [Deltaproteobacteria bacterium]
MGEPGQAVPHRPVMVREVTGLLVRGPGGFYVDGTVGAGGHAEALLEASGPQGRLLGMDRDASALAVAARRLARFGSRVELVKGDFREMKAVLAGRGVEAVDGVILDLGVSSMQLDEPGRGMSFRRDERLDMRMDREGGLSALELVNGADEGELERIIRAFGEERAARAIARAIVRARERAPIETTGRLAAVVREAVPARLRPRSIDPATRTFQALRIAVNRELEGLDAAIRDAAQLLRPGARLAVIAFHSLEDRIVKRTLRELAAPCVCPPGLPRCACGRSPLARLLGRRARRPSPAETESNRRARSARLRVVERI